MCITPRSSLLDPSCFEQREVQMAKEKQKSNLAAWEDVTIVWQIAVFYQPCRHVCFCCGGGWVIGFLLLGSLDCLFVCLFLFAWGPQPCEPCFTIRCHTTLNPGQFPEVFGTHTLTHTLIRLPPGDCHSPPLCPGILYLCTCSLAAWKPGSAGHVVVAMRVEVHFSFLSSSFCPYFVPFNGREGDCRFPGLPKLQCKSLGFLASHCWITFGFVLGCHTSH